MENLKIFLLPEDLQDDEGDEDHDASLIDDDERK